MNDRASMLAQLDRAAGDIVKAYRDLDVLAAMAREDGKTCRVIALDGMLPEQARMLYRSAAAVSDRSLTHGSVNRD